MRSPDESRDADHMNRVHTMQELSVLPPFQINMSKEVVVRKSSSLGGTSHRRPEDPDVSAASSISDRWEPAA